MVLRNIGTLPHHSTVSQPIRPWLEVLSPKVFSRMQCTVGGSRPVGCCLFY